MDMKIIVVAICVFCITAVDAFAQSPYTKKRAEELSAAYVRLQSDSSASAQQAFLRAFPEEWTDFLCIFDYIDLGGRDTERYIERFGSLTAVNDTAYCIKLLMLASGADLEAGLPEAFRNMLHQRLECCSCVRSTKEISSNKDVLPIVFMLLADALPGDQMRFWQFYWSSLHSKEGGFASHEQELMRMRGRLENEGYKDLTEIMEIAYKYFNDGVLYLYDKRFKAD